MYSESFLSKQQLIELYRTSYRRFVVAIESIKEQIGWKSGKQYFSPKQVRIIIEHLGPPLGSNDFN
ncbi:DUF4248 domain-containing protein [Rudanella paleaurantiibacter]|uniref:DUF4248 domain-containing protein n=1 Tax=Rudanella paleaurantiibacter TaxID=2614655 RepID=A0A7J5TVW0_9BACT|nr:DUF4248 domain-containing protein [Rudanella paleaurantiibacter]